MSRYRVDTFVWVRSYDGDDWVDTVHTQWFDNLDRAIAEADTPMYERKSLIASSVFEAVNERRRLLYERDWISDTVKDFRARETPEGGGG